MKKLKIKQLVMAIGLCSSATYLQAGELLTDRAVVKNDGSEQIEARVYFADAVEGDLYTATIVNGKLLFIANEGSILTLDPLPAYADQIYMESVPLFDFSSANIPPPNYPLYQVVVKTGKDPLNPDNWKKRLGWA